MFNALVWSFDFDLCDMSNEVWVSAVDWLFLFVSCFQIGSCSWVLIGQSAGNGDFWLVRFPGCWLVDDGTHLNPSTTRLYLKKTKTAYSSRSTWVHSMCYSIFSFMCMFCRSLFVLCAFSFGHCVIYSSSIYGFWLPLFDYLQTLLHTRCLMGSVLLIYLVFLLCGVPNVGNVSWLPFLVFITFL